MTNLYAWNTARAGSIAHPNVVGRAYSTLQRRANFLACSTNLSPNKKMRPLLAYSSQILVQLPCCNDSYIVAMKAQKKSLLIIVFCCLSFSGVMRPST
uniref:Uncharacterized protein n=1 Tax=Candidatus Kentrum sp. FM TaxID=2126340 RepID=A0A450T951_9GAMM|nr:MAG: hypothetical protein BECKFM1743C_GA0114222_103383 [Candidatus Kentron sp. FM]